jgi:polyisoprenoid-binding protein YceI
MIRRWACALALVALSLAPAAHAQDAYTIDPVHSSLAFKARHMMVSDVKGFFDTFSGSIKLDAAKIENSSVEVTIDATSVSTKNAKRDGHLKSADFFDVEKYPTITFKSKKVAKKGDQWVATGDLTMHGVTKEIELPFTLTGPVSAGDASLVGITASAELNRQDFGISWNKTLDSGGVVVGDKIKIEIEVEAKKQTS